VHHGFKDLRKFPAYPVRLRRLRVAQCMLIENPPKTQRGANQGRFFMKSDSDLCQPAGQNSKRSSAARPNEHTARVRRCSKYLENGWSNSSAALYF